LSTLGWAVKADRSGYYSVSGPEAIDPVTEYFLPLNDGPPPAVLPTTGELLAIATQQQKVLQAAATTQVSAIKERIEVLNFAQQSGDMQPDEVEEFERAAVALARWQNYRVELGRVKSSAGWPISPVWPAAPAALFSDAIS
jgi:hypothetical protein